MMRERLWLLVAMVGVSACGEDFLAVEPQEADGELLTATENRVTWVDQSEVERQSIGNCWIYAGASWVESMNKAATGTAMNTSQSYVTYWHWFDQISQGATEISTGGSYGTVIDLYTRFGLMTQAEFLPGEATAEMSSLQEEALAAINESLKSGALKTAAARRSRTKVRAELDRVWHLNADTVKLLNAVFGKGVTKTLDRAYATKAPPTLATASGTIKVLRPVDLEAHLNSKPGEAFVTKTLADAIGTGWARSGPFAWSEVSYPSSKKDRRAVQKRVQRALNDHQPVIVSWFVDFNAMGRDSTFTLEELARNGRPGHQGGHMVVMMDYEVENVPGYGTLKAGVDEKRPAALEAALSDSATIRFFRIKNSWGKYRPDRWDTTALPGYHDLYQTYLDGPIQQCDEVDPTSCSPGVPLWDVVLPAGY
jgi:hypothetical protein